MSGRKKCGLSSVQYIRDGTKREEREDKAQIEADPFVRSVMQAFPGAEIIGVRRAPLVEAAPVEDGDAVEDEE